MRRPFLLLHVVWGLLVAVALLAAWGDAPLWLRTLAGAPFVLVLPGYALVLAVDVDDRLGAIERSVVAVGANLTATVLLGLLLASVHIPLTALSWTLALGGVTLALAGLADVRDLRREPVRHDREMVVPIASMALAAAAFVVALAAAQNALPLKQARTPIVQLWALPANGTAARGTIEIGVRNVTDPKPVYALRVMQDDRTLLETTVTASVGTAKRFLVHRSTDSTTPVKAVLSRPGSYTPLRDVLSYPPE